MYTKKRPVYHKIQLGGGRAVNKFLPLLNIQGDRGSTVVKMLFYKSEGRSLVRSQLVSVDFSLT